MSRRGQTAMLGVMLGVMVFIMVVSLLFAIKKGVDTAMDALTCDAAGLSAAEEATCIAVAWFLPGFIGTALAVAIGMIGLRKLDRPKE